MKVTLDVERCEGFGSCVLTAPDFFDLDEDTNTAVLLDDEPSDATRKDVEQAVRACPVSAIHLA